MKRKRQEMAADGRYRGGRRPYGYEKDGVTVRDSEARVIRDATTGINPFNVAQSQTARGDVLVLTLFPQTGLVQTFEIDPIDADGDGMMDNPLNFAKQGRSAGR